MFGKLRSRGIRNHRFQQAKKRWKDPPTQASDHVAQSTYNFRLVRFRFSDIMDFVKTTIDIPESVMADAIRFTGAKTKREAVVMALEEFNRQQRVKDLVASFGTWDIATNDEIEAGDIAEIEGKNVKMASFVAEKL